MTTQYAIFDAETTFVGIFESKETALRYIETTPSATLREIQVLQSTLIHHTNFGWPMFEVCLNDACQAWVQAGYPWCALVEVALAYGVTTCDPHTCFVREYQNYTKGHGKYAQKSPVTYHLTPLMAEILSNLTPENKDLCAHLLEGVEEFATLEEVQKDSQNPPTPTTAEGIRDMMAHIWHQHKNWMFLEETGATMDIHSIIDHHRATHNPTETLFWTYVLCMWGGQCCFDPYTLYGCIKNHLFDAYWEDLETVRAILGGT